MTAKTLRYTLEQFENILYNGFDYKVPDEVIEKISDLAIKVGSPDYVKTPVFKKREGSFKDEPTPVFKDNNIKKKRKNKNAEVLDDTEWDSISTFQTTKIETTTGIGSDINSIRALINKITDKNFMDIKLKIVEMIEKIISENNENNEYNLNNIGITIFDIASSNRYYSKIYADLYTELSQRFEFVRVTYDENLNKFTELFNNIEYVDQSDYDKFCEINKINEKRKSLALFYVNLMNNGIIPENKIIEITRNLLAKAYEFISLENKKNEVEELTENIAILYKKQLYENDNGNNYELIDGHTISEIIEEIAKSKIKDYVSLTKKSIFKFMDLIDM